MTPTMLFTQMNNTYIYIYIHVQIYIYIDTLKRMLRSLIDTNLECPQQCYFFDEFPSLKLFDVRVELGLFNAPSPASRKQYAFVHIRVQKPKEHMPKLCKQLKPF